MNPRDHPGFLGHWSSGVIAIHADWPNYPSGEGPGFALAALGRFPSGTSFKLVSDIDRCALLVAEQYGVYEDPFDKRSFHIAVWHKDLLDLAAAALITSARALTEREFEEQSRDRMRSDLRRQGIGPPDGDPLEHLYSRNPDGTFSRIEFAPLDSYEHDDEDEVFPTSRDWLGIHEDERIRVTAEGLARLDELWAADMEIPPSVSTRIRWLLQGELYDSALRDLCAMAETLMKKISGSTAFGANLVTDFASYLGNSNRYITAYVKTFRSELRTAFKFHRNEYAHNIVDLPKGRAYALVGQLCDLIIQLEEIAAIEQGHHSPPE